MTKSDRKELVKTDLRLVMVESVKEYRRKLVEALPEIAAALVNSARRGNLPAIREIHEVLEIRDKRDSNPIVPIQINITDDKGNFQ